ncbi:MAG TPA: DUF3471 domain-containing protein [Ginsengibacter sp.]|nr:DUF3471 domain-containing protein [Ginsengibacter sp.]
MKNLFLTMVILIAFVFSKAQDTTFTEYVGTYTFPEGGPVTTVDVKIENGSLMASSSAGSSILEMVSKDTFNLVAYSGMVYFTRDSSKKVNGIKIEVQDTILEGKKESLDLAILIYSKYALWKRKYRVTI